MRTMSDDAVEFRLRRLEAHIRKMLATLAKAGCAKAQAMAFSHKLVAHLAGIVITAAMSDAETAREVADDAIHITRQLEALIARHQWSAPQESEGAREKSPRPMTPQCMRNAPSRNHKKSRAALSAAG
jgi:hypothetical protein